MALSGQLDPEGTSLAILALHPRSRALRLPCPPALHRSQYLQLVLCFRWGPGDDVFG